MKKIIAIAVCLLVWWQAQAANRLFLENQYGAEIICKVHNNNRTHKDVLMNNVETPIAHGVRVLLGFVPFDPKVRSVWVNDLAIRASRYLPLSSYVSLNGYIENDIVESLIKCCSMKLNLAYCRQNICNKDAVIIVKPSGIMSNWDLSLRWETPGYVETFKMNEY